MKNWGFVLVALLASVNGYSQDEKQVMKPVHILFEAMKTGDTAVIRKVFHPDAILFTVATAPATGQPMLRKESLADFLAAVGKPRTDVYNELVWSEKVFVDGDFAQVWTDYAFYLNTEFHHCGVDAFQLIRSDRGEWLIYGLSDTRRKTGCDVPEEVKRRVK